MSMTDKDFEEFRKRLDADSTGLEATSDADRVWFEAHPDRNFMLRDATDHELRVGSHYDQVLVCQLENGVRARVPVVVTNIGDPSEIPEDFLWALFERLTSPEITNPDGPLPGVRARMSSKMRPRDWRRLVRENPLQEVFSVQAIGKARH